MRTFLALWCLEQVKVAQDKDMIRVYPQGNGKQDFKIKNKKRDRQLSDSWNLVGPVTPHFVFLAWWWQQNSYRQVFVLSFKSSVLLLRPWHLSQVCDLDIETSATDGLLPLFTAVVICFLFGRFLRALSLVFGTINDNPWRTQTAFDG